MQPLTSVCVTWEPVSVGWKIGLALFCFKQMKTENKHKATQNKPAIYR